MSMLLVSKVASKAPLLFSLVNGEGERVQVKTMLWHIQN